MVVGRAQGAQDALPDREVVLDDVELLQPDLGEVGLSGLLTRTTRSPTTSSTAGVREVATTPTLAARRRPRVGILGEWDGPSGGSDVVDRQTPSGGGQG